MAAVKKNVVIIKGKREILTYCLTKQIKIENTSKPVNIFVDLIILLLVAL